MHRQGVLAAVSAAVLLSASTARAQPVRPGEETGLGLVGQSVPAVLKEAKSEPYAPPVGQDCASIAKEIAGLDEVLGPDADQPAEKEGVPRKAGKLLTGAIRGLIPHRGVVRMVTGADRQDKARADAAMAGWARRGYLKGLEAQIGCPGSTAAPAPPPAVADAKARRAQAFAASLPAQAAAEATQSAEPPATTEQDPPDAALASTGATSGVLVRASGPTETAPNLAR